MADASGARPTGMALAEKAIASAMESWAKMKPLVISAALASAALGAVFVLASYGVGPEFGPAQVGMSFLQAVFNAAIDAPLAVAVHRLILKGEVTAGIISLNRPYQWLFFAWLCAFAFVQFALSGLMFASKFLAVIFIIGWLVFFVKSALIFPAIAIEAPSGNWRERLKISWKQMDGNFWLFVRAILLTIVPLVFAAVLMVIAFALLGIMIGRGGLAILIVTKIVMTAVIQPAGVMLAAGIASWLYLWARDNPQAQSAQTATSTVT